MNLPEIDKQGGDKVGETCTSPQSQNLQFGGVPIHPGPVLLLSSVPFFAGAFLGYKMFNVEDLVAWSTERKSGDTAVSSSTAIYDSRSAQKKIPPISTSAEMLGNGINTAAVGEELNMGEARTVAIRTAARAFRIATLGTVGTFCLVGAIGFYTSGHQTMEEAVHGTHVWTASWLQPWREYFASYPVVMQHSSSHPDVLATKDMSEEQELRYIYEKYIQGEVDNVHESGPISPKHVAPSAKSREI